MEWIERNLSTISILLATETILRNLMRKRGLKKFTHSELGAMHSRRQESDLSDHKYREITNHQKQIATWDE